MITYIISDIHLGSQACHYLELINFLDKYDGNRLIINGDLFDSMNIRLKKDAWKVLSKLRKLSNNTEIIWVRGNHDEPHPEFLADLLGIKLVNEYIFIDNGIKFVIVHGDRWDKFITKYPLITSMADWFYKKVLQKLDKKQRIARFFKRKSKIFLRSKDKVQVGATQYCELISCNVICCGHTHFAEMVDRNDGVCYYNSGCWTEPHCGYLRIEEGCVQQETMLKG